MTRLEQLKETVRYGLDCGFTTREIAEDAGILYESILESFRRNKEDGLRIRLIHLRKREWEVKQSQLVVAPRNRCEHGAWSSSGKCEHGKQGRKVRT